VVLPDGFQKLISSGVATIEFIANGILFAITLVISFRRIKFAEGNDFGGDGFIEISGFG
jgi:hypothetical protein